MITPSLPLTDITDETIDNVFMPVVARYSLPRRSTHDGLDDMRREYKYIKDSPNSTGMKSLDWWTNKEDSSALSKAIDIMKKTLSYANYLSYKSVRTKDEDAIANNCLSMIEDWLCRFSLLCFRKFSLPEKAPPETKLKYKDIVTRVIKDPKNVPFGGNWYHYSVNYAQLAAHYLLFSYILDDTGELTFASQDKDDTITRPQLRELVARSILAFVSAVGSEAFGMKRSKSQKSLMFGPYCVAKYTLNQHIETIKSEEFRYTLQDLLVPMKTNHLEDGLHRDMSYFDHEAVSFKHLEIQSDSDNAYAFEFVAILRDHTQSPQRIWNSLSEYILHPEIEYGFVGMFGRKVSLMCPKNPRATRRELLVLPFSRIMVFKTPETAFSVRLQQKNMPFFESIEYDENQCAMAPNWVQLRRVFERNQRYLPTFPDNGFILCTDDSKQVSKVIVRGEKGSRTTKSHMPQSATSFVFRFGRHAFGYQTYEIPELVKKAFVSELIHIDASIENGEFIDIQTKIVNNNSQSMRYVPINTSKHINIEPKSTEIVRTRISYRKDEPVKYELVEEKLPNLLGPFMLNFGNNNTRYVQFKLYSDCAVCFMNDAPVIMCPLHWDKEETRIAKTIEGQDYVFTFDNVLLQYVRHKNLLY
ncbi:hypothetical protein QAD02_001430 [Eretmocerus hayati]|uniref:Uncharacterized protein n=1 Tax=Eretmocerus hayati TaxID=131215 RepID=A0ACC2NGY2_9HYME|nr:hypothetical protein QAD02_001430 [Eretmocerus hayati]